MRGQHGSEEGPRAVPVGSPPQSPLTAPCAALMEQGPPTCTPTGAAMQDFIFSEEGAPKLGLTQMTHLLSAFPAQPPLGNTFHYRNFQSAGRVLKAARGSRPVPSSCQRRFSPWARTRPPVFHPAASAPTHTGAARLGAERPSRLRALPGPTAVAGPSPSLSAAAPPTCPGRRSGARGAQPVTPGAAGEPRALSGRRLRTPGQRGAGKGGGTARP